MRSRIWKLTDFQIDWLEEYSRVVGIPEDEIMRRAIDEFIIRKVRDRFSKIAAARAERYAKDRRHRKAKPIEEQVEQEIWEAGEEVVTFGLGSKMGIQETFPLKKRKGRPPGSGRKKTPFDREVEYERKNQDTGGD